MPQIPDRLVDSIVTFLNEYGVPVGTGFVMRYGEVSEAFFESFYLVTCEHCVPQSKKARFCTGAVISVAPSDWRNSNTGDDVVVLDITELVAGWEEPIGHIDAGEILGRNKEPFFGIGADLYMLGLLADEKDVGRNIPRARFGNLSALADDEVPARQGNDAERPCHLADMRSRTGFSGSPVIGYLEIPATSGHVNYKERLLGIHSAQHMERIELVGMSNYQKAVIASSMTRIVPAWIIVEVIESDAMLVDRRENRKQAVPP